MAGKAWGQVDEAAGHMASYSENNIGTQHTFSI